MAVRKKLTPKQLRWMAIGVGLLAFLAVLGSKQHLAMDLNGNFVRTGWLAASVGPITVKSILATGAILIVGLLYLASVRSPDAGNSN